MMIDVKMEDVYVGWKMKRAIWSFIASCAGLRIEYSFLVELWLVRCVQVVAPDVVKWR